VIDTLIILNNINCNTDLDWADIKA